MIKLELLYYPIPSPCLPSHPIFISAPALFCPSSPLVIYSLSQVLYSEPVLFSCMFFHLEDPCPLWLIQSSQSWDLGLYVCFYVALYTHHSIKHNEPCPQCCDHSYPPPPPLCSTETCVQCLLIDWSVWHCAIQTMRASVLVARQFCMSCLPGMLLGRVQYWTTSWRVWLWWPRGQLPYGVQYVFCDF